MIAPPRPPSHDELELLIKEARERQLRRRLLGAAGIAIAAAIGLGVYAVTIGGVSNVAQPTAQGGRASAPLCRSTQLSGSAYFQGATQTMLGGVTILNTSDAACTLPNRRPAAYINWHGKRLPTNEAAMPAPAGFSRVGLLAPDTKASVFWQWRSCGGPGPRAAVRPTIELPFGHGLVVTARSGDVTPAFCGGLGGRRLLDVSRPLTPG
jgi:hypothetical protein